MRRWLTLALAAHLVAGCGPSEPSPSAVTMDIEGIEWIAVSVAGLTPDHASAPTLTIESGRITGSTGCNSYGARATLSGGSIAIRDLGSTLIGCAGPIADLEAAFMRALAAADRVAIVAGELVVSGPGGELRFGRGFGP